MDLFVPLKNIGKLYVRDMFCYWSLVGVELKIVHVFHVLGSESVLRKGT